MAAGGRRSPEGRLAPAAVRFPRCPRPGTWCGVRVSAAGVRGGRSGCVSESGCVLGAVCHFMRS